MEVVVQMMPKHLIHAKNLKFFSTTTNVLHEIQTRCLPFPINVDSKSVSTLKENIALCYKLMARAIAKTYMILHKQNIPSFFSNCQMSWLITTQFRAFQNNIFAKSRQSS